MMDFLISFCILRLVKFGIFYVELILTKSGLKFQNTKKIFRVYKAIQKDYLINFMKNITRLAIHLMD